jgi:hypothetical protein
MFNPILRIHPQFLLATLTLSAILGAVADVPARAQIVIIRDRSPVQFVPRTQRDSYVDKSPIINASPTPSRILQPNYSSPYDTLAPTRRVIRRTIYPASSGTTVLINPTIVVPSGYDYGYPYPDPQGSYIYYGSPSGFQIQLGY